MEQRTSGGGASHDNGDLGGVARRISSEAEEQLDVLRERLSELNERVTGFIRERPGTSILIALGCGWLIGRMLRS
jgi:hypothetical protein